MSRPDMRSRICGGILGTLVGDALGVPVEFTGRSIRDADPVTGMRGYGTWKQPPGTWSDDGAMSLATVAAIVEHGWDLGQMMEGFRRWLDEAWMSAHGAVFDVGNTTRNAIMLYRIDKDWSNCGGDEEHCNGNGSLMRCLPVSLWLIGDSVADRIRLAGDASALTHAHLRSRLCCAWHAHWCEVMMTCTDVRTGVAAVASRLRRECPEREQFILARILDGTILDVPRDQIPSDGYVVSTMEASLWCLALHDRFDAAVLAAVNLGGDTDTTGAVVGGMAGWLYGREAIPVEWINALPRHHEIGALAEQFAERCQMHWGARGSH